MLLFFLALLQRFINADEQTTCISPPSDLNEDNLVYKCEDQNAQRSGTAYACIYISSSLFKNLKVKNDGVAVYATFAAKEHNCFVYNCQFENCVSSKSGGVGGAIRIKIENSKDIVNITKCTFKDNSASLGGGIYFNGIQGLISECIFINNIATNSNGGDIYYISGDAKENSEASLLIQKCKFTRDKQDTATSIVHLKWTDVADFKFMNNEVNINVENVFAFNQEGADLGPKGTFDCENNLINSLSSIIPESIRVTQIGLKLLAGFTKIPDSENPDKPGPTNPNCPSPPEDNVDIKDFTNQVNRYVYGCEKTRSNQLKADRCVVYLYSCIFDSSNSGTGAGGALFLAPGLSSNTVMPTPEGNSAIYNCTFNKCVGSSGGAIYLSTQDSNRLTDIVNCTFTNNKATNEAGSAGGGALYIHATYVIIKNCSFIDNEASAKGQEIYFYIFETEIDTEYPLLITNCTILQNHVSSKSALIYLEWSDKADMFFNYNRIKLADDLIAYLFEDNGVNIASGNLSCKANSLLPSHDLLCPKDTILYQRVRYGFQNSDAPKDDIVFDSADSCKDSASKRCQTVNKDNVYEHVSIEISKFENFDNDDNGGAVYLVNTGVTCIGSTYSNCKSKSAGGGAIFLFNDIKDIVNYAKFEGITVNSCSAVFGGAAYVYSSSDKNEVTFTSSKFSGNTAQTKGNSKGLFGGGALYLTINVGKIKDCEFISNNGGGVKINDDFDMKPEQNKASAMKLSLTAHSLLTISGCKFEAEKNSESASLLFVNGKTKKQVKDCVFTGKLAKGSYHINAIEPENVRVENCRFSSSMKQAFNSNIIMSDTSNKVIKENSIFSMKLCISMASFVAVCCAAVALLVIRKIGVEEKEEENAEEENKEIALTSLECESKL